MAVRLGLTGGESLAGTGELAESRYLPLGRTPEAAVSGAMSPFMRRLWRATLAQSPAALIDEREAAEALPGRVPDAIAWLREHVRPVGEVGGVAVYRWSMVVDAIEARERGGPAMGKQGPADALLSPDQLAAALGVPVSAVHRWTSDRRIPFFKIGHKTVRYRLIDVLAAAEQTTAAAEEHPHGRKQARRPMARRVPIPGPDDGSTSTIPAYDWSQHLKARG